ncbi:MAG: MBL fold metallo-hydrolase [Gammaproteobacteria bacterium]|nr:MBL fold metallo-hydrolase [Gammaproteobacteria bacterium]
MKTEFGPEMPAFARLASGIRRLVAPNPSMMTGPGTNTYLIGEDEVAVIDPGPAIPEHVENIIIKAGGYIRWILATHTHPDHSPGIQTLAEKTGAEVLGMPAPAGEHQDRTFAPTRLLADGDVLETGEFRLEAVHTPGHASNHLCYLHSQQNWLFTGDHVIDGSTVVIDPPDGNMKHYIESLQRCIDLECDAMAPGHGEVITEPRPAIEWIIAHRLQREARVLAAVQANPGLTSHELVPLVYKDVDPKLYGWAERSLLAHMLKLKEDGLI